MRNNLAEAVTLVDCGTGGGGCLKRLLRGVGGGRLKSGDALGGGWAKTGFGRFRGGEVLGDVSRADKGGGGEDKPLFMVQCLKMG